MHKIEFKVNYNKTLEAILYLLSKRDGVNLYNVVKALYAADKYHLNKYGRPVTGDVYLKKQYGVLPEIAYSIFNKDPMILDILNLDSFPITNANKEHHYKATRAPNESFFSISDKEALEFGVTEYFDMTFKEVESKNHLEKSWKNAEYDRPINIEDMIENPEILEELKDNDNFSIVV